MLISTHILQEVEAVADRVLLIHAGRLLYDGPRVDLEENGSLEEPFYRLTKEPAPAPATRGVDLPSGRPGDDATAR